MQKKVQVIECVKVILNDPLFKDNHRTDTDFFTRDRKLSFVLLILLILQKSLKSLQPVLNEFFVKLSVPSVIVAASAFTQARAELSRTAFIELNQKAVAETYYRDNDYKTWRGFRKENDLLLSDRNCPSYLFPAALILCLFCLLCRFAFG